MHYSGRIHLGEGRSEGRKWIALFITISTGNVISIVWELENGLIKTVIETRTMAYYTINFDRDLIF